MVDEIEFDIMDADHESRLNDSDECTECDECLLDCFDEDEL